MKGLGLRGGAWLAPLAGLASLLGCAPSAAETGAEGGSGGGTGPLRIAAAASLADLAADWGELWVDLQIEQGESKRGADVVAGASSSLARQVAAGAPFDVYLSAHVDWVDWLEERELVQVGARQTVARNALVVVGPKSDSEASFDATLLSSGRWALADPSHVPAGVFAREAISQIVPWGSFAERIVPTPDVRAALRLVETGALDRGVVYRTDAVAAPSVRVLCEVPARLHSPALVVAAALPRGGDDARSFINVLLSDAARAAARARGFLSPE